MGGNTMVAAGFRACALALFCAACTSIAADARTFEGTRWRVTAIDGRFIPEIGNYFIEFSHGHIGGQFGCNHFGGDYRIQRDAMVASAIRMTMMACSDPAAKFEAQGTAVLNAPMRMDWGSSQRVRLDNPAGSIDLSLLP